MEWFSGPITDAIRLLKTKQTFLLVLVKGSEDDSSNTYAAFNDANVKDAFKDCICLCMDANSPEAAQFSAIYPVMVVPSVYFIDSDGNPLEVLVGNSTADRLLEKLSPLMTAARTSAPPELVPNPPPAASSSASEPLMTSLPISTPTETSATTSGLGPAASTTTTTASLEERVFYARQRLEAKRAEKERAEAEKQLQQEIERREMGKLMLDSKKTREEQERLEAIAERRREMAADREHREKLKRQLEDDRRERAARRQQTSSEVSNNATKATSSFSAPPEVTSSNSTTCRLQLRFPDGATCVHEFHSTDDTLSVVRNFVKEEAKASADSQRTYDWVAKGQFYLAVTFPRRVFRDEDEHRTLRELHLAPASALLVMPLAGQGIQSGQSASGSGSGILAQTGGFVMALVLSVWGSLCYLLSFVTSMLPFGAAARTNTPGVGGPATTSRAPRRETDPSAPQDQGQQAKGVKFRGERRLHDLRRDDDDTATWNGNSTQQM